MSLQVHIEQQLKPYIDQARPVWVALSGGVDSMVLLHLCVTLKQQFPDMALRACHVHHGLSQYADSWLQHCQAVCQQWQVDLVYRRIHLDDIDGQGLEAKAREGRYEVLAQESEDNAVIVTGHHLQDQSETLLLRLKRGAGPTGLAAMAPVRKFSQQRLLCRPLLSIGKPEIQEYAHKHGLSWVEDDSNQDTRFERNFIRQDVLPLMRERWPQIDQMLARSALLCSQESQLLNTLLQDKLTQAVDSQGRFLLSALGNDQALNFAILRAWLQHFDVIPSLNHLTQIIETVVTAKVDASPQLALGKVTIRRFQQWLYCESTSLPALPQSCAVSAPETRLPEGLGKLQLQPASADGGADVVIDEAQLSNVNLRFGLPSGKFEVANRNGRKTAKQIAQEQGIPPWQRTRVPVLYWGDELLGCPGVFITPRAKQIQQMAKAPLTIRWTGCVNPDLTDL